VFIYLALSTCLVLYIQKSDFYLVNVFCAVIIVKKCTVFSLGSLFLFCTIEKPDTLKFDPYDQSYAFTKSAVQIDRWS